MRERESGKSVLAARHDDDDDDGDRVDLFKEIGSGFNLGLQTTSESPPSLFDCLLV